LRLAEESSLAVRRIPTGSSPAPGRRRLHRAGRRPGARGRTGRDLACGRR